MKLKKLGFLLSVTFAIALTACAGKTENQETSATKKESTGTEITSTKAETGSTDSITIKHAFGETVIEKNQNEWQPYPGGIRM